jgi:DNA-binding response OmpR family regulator
VSLVLSNNAVKIRNVLVVEDDQMIGQGIKQILESEGFNVILATDGLQGIVALIQNRPDLVLLDLILPGMNGWQFIDIQRSLRDYREIPIVICSAMLESAKSIQPTAILSKPFHIDDLVEKVKKNCYPKSALA